MQYTRLHTLNFCTVTVYTIDYSTIPSLDKSQEKKSKQNKMRRRKKLGKNYLKNFCTILIQNMYFKDARTQMILAYFLNICSAFVQFSNVFFVRWSESFLLFRSTHMTENKLKTTHEGGIDAVIYLVSNIFHYLPAIEFRRILVECRVYWIAHICIFVA